MIASKPHFHVNFAQPAQGLYSVTESHGIRSPERILLLVLVRAITVLLHSPSLSSRAGVSMVVRAYYGWVCG
jgi:hypothetical protein